MSITGELRKYARGYELTVNHKLLEIADNIDAEHERVLTIVLAEQHDPLTDNVKPMTDENMAEHGWVRLPKDADGEYIHVGDVMEVKHDTKKIPFTVSFIGDGAVAFWADGELGLNSFNINTVLLQHHRSTAEDVLREFADEYAYVKGGCDEDGIVAEYAKKLKEMIGHERD